jgi:hypothetical protein
LLPLLPWCSVSNPPLPLVSFRTPCYWDVLRERSTETRDIRFDEVPKKYPLTQERIVVFEIRLHSYSPMLYRPALHGNWNALNFASRALKDKFPTPTVPLTTVLQNCQVFLPHPIYYVLYKNWYYLSCWFFASSCVKSKKELTKHDVRTDGRCSTVSILRMQS